MTAIDFARMPQVITAGQAAVTKQAEKLAALALPAGEYAAYASARQRSADPSFNVAFVRPAPRSEADAKRIDAVFGSVVGHPFDTDVLQSKAYRQYGLDRFEAVDYRVVRDDGERGLEIDLRRKSWGPNFLRFGMSIESDYEGGTVANAGARLLMTERQRARRRSAAGHAARRGPAFRRGAVPAALAHDRHVRRAGIPLPARDAADRRRRATGRAVSRPRHRGLAGYWRGTLELGRGATRRQARQR